MRIDIVFDEIAEYLIQQYTATSKHNQVDIVRTGRLIASQNQCNRPREDLMRKAQSFLV